MHPQTIKRCALGHPLQPSWLRCPVCPEPRRVRVPPTRVHKLPVLAAAAPPKPAKARRTELIEVAEQEPCAAWLLGLEGRLKGQQFRLKLGKNSIGSAEGCDIRIEDSFVSSRHANISHLRKDGEDIFVLVDLDSQNGSFLNGGKEREERVELVDSDRVEFGRLAFKFKCI